MSALNRDSAKFQARVVGALILAVQIKVLSEELHSRFFLKIYLTENLKIADIGYRVGSKVLWAKLEKCRTSRKNFELGGEKPWFM